MVTTSQNRNGMVCNWFYTRCNNRMNIIQLEREILNAIKIESKELKVLYDKHNEDGEYLLTLKNFVKKLFKEHRNEH